MRLPLALAVVATPAFACSGGEPKPVAAIPAPVPTTPAAPELPTAPTVPAAPGVPTDAECTLGVEAFTPRFATSGPGLSGPPAVRKIARTLTETVTVDGVRITREFGGCHHVLERYTWRGVAVVADPAANMAAIADRLGRLPLAEPTADSVAGLLREAAVAVAGKPEVRDGAVDGPCGDATCTFRFVDEGGAAALVAEYQFAL